MGLVELLDSGRKIIIAGKPLPKESYRRNGENAYQYADFITAGADIIGTDTCYYTRIGISQDEAIKKNEPLHRERFEIETATRKELDRIYQATSGTEILVAGVIGHCYRGITDDKRSLEHFEGFIHPTRALEYFQQQAEALNDTDLYLLTDMGSIVEAKLAIEACNSIGSGRPIAVAFNPYNDQMGETKDYSDKVLETEIRSVESSVYMVGMTSSNPITPEQVAAMTKKPVIVYVTTNNPDVSRHTMSHLIESEGVSIIGGTLPPSYIAQLREIFPQ